MNINMATEIMNLPEVPLFIFTIAYVLSIFIKVAFNTVYPEILAVIKFGDLPQIWQKCIIGGI